MPSVTVDVDVDLDEFTTAELTAELVSRGHSVDPDFAAEFEAELAAIYTCLKQCRVGDAMTIVERLREPKWKNKETCEEKYMAALMRKAA